MGIHIDVDYHRARERERADAARAVQEQPRAGEDERESGNSDTNDNNDLNDRKDPPLIHVQVGSNVKHMELGEGTVTALGHGTLHGPEKVQMEYILNEERERRRKWVFIHALSRVYSRPKAGPPINSLTSTVRFFYGSI